MRRLRQNKLGWVGLAAVIFLSCIAVFAPFLADHRPILMKQEDVLSSPLMSGLTASDWFLFGGFWIAAGFWIAFRLLMRKGWTADRAGRCLWRITLPLWIGLAVFCLTRKEFVDSKDYGSMKPGFAPGEWALFPPIPYAFDQQNLYEIYENPGAGGPRGVHWLGTDATGRDVLARLIHGSRISLSIGFVAVGLYVLIGTGIGALAGYYGGRVDAALSRLIEIVLCFPTLFLILAVLAVLPQSIFTIMVVIGFTRWPDVARLVRGEFLKHKAMEYVDAARALGTPAHRIIFRHVLPNAWSPISVSATFGISGAILIESALSFLGLGAPPPAPSWGQALSAGREGIAHWWMVVFPGGAIFATMTAFNLLGEALRDAMDPRLKT
ncbi:MAG: ABC transporter permease [Planctomycetes bacterium]|nr:ABC transporter permease [Planctomycetota bacterium]